MRDVNLLPWRRQRRQRTQRIFCAQVAASFAAAAALTALLGFHLGARVDRQEQRNGRLTTQIADLDRGIAQLDAARRQRDENAGRASVLAALWRQRSAAVAIFDALAQTAVADVHYSELTRRGDTLTVHGLAASNGSVSQLMRSLDESPRFATPGLNSIGTVASRDYGHEAVTFTLTFVVEPFRDDAGAPRRPAAGG